MKYDPYEVYEPGVHKQGEKMQNNTGHLHSSNTAADLHIKEKTSRCFFHKVLSGFLGVTNCALFLLSVDQKCHYKALFLIIILLFCAAGIIHSYI